MRTQRGGNKPEYEKPAVTKVDGKVTPEAKKQYQLCVDYQRDRFDEGEIALTPAGRCSAEFTHRVYPSAYGNIAGASVSRGNKPTFLGEIDPDCAQYFQNKGEPLSEACAALQNGSSRKAKATRKTTPPQQTSQKKHTSPTKPTRSSKSSRPTRSASTTKPSQAQLQALYSYTNKELQSMLREQHLPTSGRKQQLVDRLAAQGVKPKIKPAKKRSPKPKSNLVRWIDEEWVNVCEPDPNTSTGYQPCGRSQAKLDSENYPYCRPYYRLSPKTPKTVNEIIAEEGQEGLAKRCEEKRKLRQGIDGKPSYYRPTATEVAQAKAKARRERKTRQVKSPKTSRSGKGKTKPSTSNTAPNMDLVHQYNRLQPCVDPDTGLYQPERVTDSARHKLRVKVRDPKSGRIKTVKYGHPDYQDYTTHRDQSRRQSYCKRSGGIKCGSRPGAICDQTTPNFWARTSLWDCPMSQSELRQSVTDPQCRKKLSRKNKLKNDDK